MWITFKKMKDAWTIFSVTEIITRTEYWQLTKNCIGAHFQKALVTLPIENIINNDQIK